MATPSAKKNFKNTNSIVRPRIPAKGNNLNEQTKKYKNCSIELPEVTGKAFVLDTNVLIHDPECCSHLMGDKENTIFIPWIVIQELDGLKNKPDIGFDAEKALFLIEKMQKSGDQPIEIIQNPSFRGLKKNLDPKSADHQIIATAHFVQKHLSFRFKDVRLISKDRTVRILADRLGINVEDYYRDKSEIPPHKMTLPKINVPAEAVNIQSLCFPFVPEIHGDIQQNTGVVVVSNLRVTKNSLFPEKDWREAFTAIRKGDAFKIITGDICAFGFKPFSLDNDQSPVWAQQVALSQGMDNEVKCLILQGASGSGKTTLALALALQRRSQFRKIIVTRPMIHLEDRDRIGFLKGDLRQKMHPWLKPIEQALEFLSELNSSNKKIIDTALSTNKIDFVALDYVRGTTFHRSCIILDEAQNLTPMMMKTVLTRVGHDSFIILTGDLGQIDRQRRLNAETSGLAYAMSRLEGNPMVAITNFPKSVRSKFAALAEEVL